MLSIRIQPERNVEAHAFKLVMRQVGIRAQVPMIPLADDAHLRSRCYVCSAPFWRPEFGSPYCSDACLTRALREEE